MPGPATLSEVGSMEEPLTTEEPLSMQQQETTAQQTNRDSVRTFVYIPGNKSYSKVFYFFISIQVLEF